MKRFDLLSVMYGHGNWTERYKAVVSHLYHLRKQQLPELLPLETETQFAGMLGFLWKKVPDSDKTEVEKYVEEMNLEVYGKGLEE